MRATVFEAAGGDDAFLRLAAAHHARCLADPVLSHPFDHGVKLDHVERLAIYWAEVFGGPARFAETCGDHSAMLELHARCEAEDDLGRRFLDCFTAAADDAGLPADPELRQVLRAYMEWAVDEVMGYAPVDSVVPGGLTTPRWSWDGLVELV
jgi:hemoglobin